MKCPHERKIGWESDTYLRVACLDCGEILICDPLTSEAADIIETTLKQAEEPVPIEVVAPAKVAGRPAIPRNPVLSEKGKLVMELRAMNWTYDDIAKHIGKSVGVVKMFETAAKKALKREEK